MVYVALLRGISPTSPNMRNEKLRAVFKSLGFKNVRTVISSGNVLFESGSKNTARLELSIENAIKQQLGFFSTTLIRSQAQLQSLVDADPFKGVEHSRETYLIVTFFKSTPKPRFSIPYSPEGKAYNILAQHDAAICTVVNTAASKTPDFMVWIEKEFGKQVTTRTWKTVGRILKTMV